MGATLDDLRSILEDTTRGLADVSVRRAFGSFGFFAGDSIFALAYSRELRIGVKLPDEASFASLLGIDGSRTWAPHKSPMRGWVLVPESWHDETSELVPWVRRAYEQIVRASEDDVPSMRPRAAKKTSAKKTSSKKAPAKKTSSKKAPAKKSSSKKAPAKKTSSKKTSSKKIAAKR